MRTKVSDRLSDPVQYLHLIRGMAKAGWGSVYAICYEPERALVVHSGCYDIPPGKILGDLDYFEPYFGTIILEG
ncbi:hypothetical protein MQM1_038 [Aeromonas phage vB_AsaP_MQM1]|nr:hypothetical protein MQM1_038 [Aeromonas phage vB_AsaP_MQM1]